MFASWRTAIFSAGESAVEMRHVVSPSLGMIVPHALSYSTPLLLLSPMTVFTDLRDDEGTTDSAAPESIVNSIVSHSPMEFVGYVCLTSKTLMSWFSGAWFTMDWSGSRVIVASLSVWNSNSMSSSWLSASGENLFLVKVWHWIFSAQHSSLQWSMHFPRVIALDMNFFLTGVNPEGTSDGHGIGGAGAAIGAIALAFFDESSVSSMLQSGTKFDS